ncbi:MAG: tetratricopeptide repeat protein, partial [Anaerolineales bacterium]|nr:tetratricopeptide repeat protein [Anaerolineales bacterium]
LGSLPDCEIHVREALRLLDSPIPRSSFQFALGVIPQIVRQTFHRFFPSRYIGAASSGREREVAIEVARLYELMSRVYFYSNETLPIIYVALRFLNEAEKAGASPELAVAYSSMAVLAGFAQLHNLAETYVARGIDVAEKVNQPSTLITVNVVTSVYQITVGKWDEVRARALKAKAICEELGDYRQWGDSTVLLAESALIAGDIQYALGIQRVLLKDARQRHNPLQQLWALFGVAANSIRLGNEAEAIPLLEEALRILEELPNFASSINTNAQLALAHHRLGNTEKALDYADRVLSFTANLRPTVYSLDVGFTAVAEVYFELWEKALQKPDGTVDAVRMKYFAERAVKLLRAFKNVFPIGQPSLLYYRGWYEWLNGRRQGAVKLWRDGLEAARKFRMRYDEGLIHLKLGAALAGDADLRREHFNEAIRIFGEMDAVPMLRRARELADQR